MQAVKPIVLFCLCIACALPPVVAARPRSPSSSDIEAGTLERRRAERLARCYPYQSCDSRNAAAELQRENQEPVRLPEAGIRDFCADNRWVRGCR